MPREPKRRDYQPLVTGLLLTAAILGSGLFGVALSLFVAVAG